MNDTVNLSTFPDNRYEALTMLYLKRQDLSSVTPEGLVELYLETLQMIKEKFKAVRDERRK